MQCKNYFDWQRENQIFKYLTLIEILLPYVCFGRSISFRSAKCYNANFTNWLLTMQFDGQFNAALIPVIEARYMSERVSTFGVRDQLFTMFSLLIDKLQEVTTRRNKSWNLDRCKVNINSAISRTADGTFHSNRFSVTRLYSLLILSVRDTLRDTDLYFQIYVRNVVHPRNEIKEKNSRKNFCILKGKFLKDCKNLFSRSLTRLACLFPSVYIRLFDCVLLWNLSIAASI